MTVTSSVTRRRADLCSPIEDELDGLMSCRALAPTPWSLKS